jgi:hypothetical protein
MPRLHVPLNIANARSWASNTISCVSRGYRQHVIGGRLLLTVRGARIHQPTPLFERVIAPVRLLSFVANRVRKRCLSELTRKLGAIAAPIAKSRAEAVRRDITAIHPA